MKFAGQFFNFLFVGTNNPMIDAIVPRVNIVVENNLYSKLEQLIQQKTMKLSNLSNVV